VINRTKVVNDIFGIVGVEQPLDPDFPIIDAANLTSESGYIANQIPLSKLQYLIDTQDYKDIDTTQFNTLVTNTQKQSIAAVVSSVFNKPEFRERQMLYKYTQNKVNVETLPVGFVGYRVRVTKENNVALNIPRVLLDFQGTGSIEIILWDSAKLAAIETKVIAITTDHQEEELNWVLDNTEGTFKSEYWIGYNTTGLTVQPFKRDYENSNIKTCYKDLIIEDRQVAGHTGTTLFDLTQTQGNSLSTGLNFDFMIYDDYTDWAISSKLIFAKAIYLDFAIKIMSSYLGSLRSNRSERKASNIAEMILNAIHGDVETGKGGMKNSLLGELSRLRKEVDKLHKGQNGGLLTLDTLT
jgi:hypothetical protein